MPEQSYDFVIIGGGTAGLVVANRLTEDAAVNVVVLEAGEDMTEDPRVTTPALFPTLLGTAADWNTVTEPQSALGNKSINVPHGKVLGGSSAINGQAFVATSKIGIDEWERLGNPGWSWADLETYFQKTHTLCLPTDPAIREHLHLDYVDEKVRGYDGPIQASFPDDLNNPLPNAWIKTMTALGHSCTGDPFSGKITGVYTNAASIDPADRQRSYSASAYWKPVQDRPNLHVITGAHVEKIILSGAYPEAKAEGVLYSKGGQLLEVQASKEIILSAGTLHSPKLLELSGIGNSQLLQSLEIPVFIDNPYVGENLQDHPMTGMSFEVRQGVNTIDDLLRQDPAALQAAVQQYGESKAGPLAVAGIFSYAFLPLEEVIREDTRAELHQSLDKYTYPEDTHPLKKAHTEYLQNLLLNPNESTAGFFTYAAQGNFGKGSGSGLMTSDFLPGSFYSIAICLLQPLSRGNVHIQSSDPNVPVRLDPKYLSHPLDLEVLARHTQYIGTIVETEPLKSLLMESGLRNTAAPEDLGDLEALRQYVKDTTLSSWHPTSSCAMLPEKIGGVVDPRLVVYGTKNLRVVDASIFPITSRGNPMATVYAVAEKAADLIKETLKYD